MSYDTVQKKSLTWTQKLSDQLNLAYTYVARGKYEKKLKQTKRQCPLIVQYRFKIREGSLEGIRMTMEERICETDEF